MSSIPEHFRITTHPQADDNAIVVCGSARFTVLTDRLIRLEYSPSGAFVDQASQAIWFRHQPVPQFTTSIDEKTLHLETDYLHLEYHFGQDAPFNPGNLSITLKSSDVRWTPESSDAENLLGTTRTLDYINGYAPLEQGLVSRAGWSVIDDSQTLLLNDEGWLEPRPHEGQDQYFLGYGHDYKACLQDYCRISGKMPLIPRWILGNWWSRYWAYSQDDLTQLIQDFSRHELPFSVLIVDMDWHITETNNASSGWTGYTWNRSLFPNPEGFLKFAHDHNLKIGLNLHPAEGVHDHEEQYENMARAVGIDPATGEPVTFNITDPDYADAYFKYLHHPYEAMGVDFWWLDWQQGQKSAFEGLDPLWLINHLHFYDSGRDGKTRPFIFSRWGNEGHVRYPIGFSGDSYATWDTLNFQSYMTSTASNIAYGWWSHDIGGHTSGNDNPELTARWLQFGVLSPINRIHATKGFFYDRRPWFYENAEVFEVMRDALQLRHALIPYIYTMARRAHDESQPVIQPMYYDYPEHDEAYHVPHQYMFGSELLTAPFVQPADEHTRLSKQVVWLPEGDWYHVLSGAHYQGQRWHPIYGTLKDIPLFARAGAIVPFAWNEASTAYDNPAFLEFRIFAGHDGQFSLYEDDGTSTAHENGAFCRTNITQGWHDDHMTITIEAAQGDTTLIPAQRHITLAVFGVVERVSIEVAASSGEVLNVRTAYDAEREVLRVEGITLTPDMSLTVVIRAEQETLLARRDRQRETLMRMLKFFDLLTPVRNSLVNELDQIIEDPQKLASYEVLLQDSQLSALCEVLFDAGVHWIRDTLAPNLLLLWNNRADERLTFRYNDAYLYFGLIRYRHHEAGVVPPYQHITPPADHWRHGALGENVQRTQWLIHLNYANIFTKTIGYQEDSP